MNGPLRRAGRGRLPDGSTIVWTVAEGRRGRRWRATTTRDGGLVRSLLLELDTDGRPAKLELATAAGLLTLHPEPDGRSAHGNAATTTGMRHLAFPWSPVHGLLVAGDPISAAALARSVGEGRAPVLLVAGDLTVTATECRVALADGQATVTAAEGVTIEVSVDPDGLPRGLGDAADWPLEEG